MDEKPIASFSTGSLFSTSEGWQTLGMNGVFAAVMTGDYAWQAQAAAAIGAAIMVAAYTIGRSNAKQVEG